jgi:hypothetical protein
MNEEEYKFEAGDKCVFCEVPMHNFIETHNPDPIADMNRGRCCAICNTNLVVTARIMLVQGYKLDEVLSIINNSKYFAPKYKNSKKAA